MSAGQQTRTEQPEVLEWLAGVDAGPTVTPEDLHGLRARVRDTLAREDESRVAGLRATPTRRRVIVLLGGLLAVVLLIAAVSPRPDLAGYPLVRLLISLLGLLGVAASAVWLALRPLHRRAAPSALRWAITAAVLAAPTAVALLPEVRTGLLLHPSAFTPDVLRSSLACVGLGAVVGVPPLLLAALLDRGGLHTSLRALLAGAAAVAVANAGLLLHCPANEPGHLLVGHAGLIVPFALLWLGLRWLRTKV